MTMAFSCMTLFFGCIQKVSQERTFSFYKKGGSIIIPEKGPFENANSPILSPDGEKLLFNNWSVGPVNYNENLFLVDIATAKGKPIFQTSSWSIVAFAWIDNRRIAVWLSSGKGGLIRDENSIFTNRMVILTLFKDFVKSRVVRQAKVRYNKGSFSLHDNGILEYDTFTSEPPTKRSAIFSDLRTGRNIIWLSQLVNSIIKKLNARGQDYLGINLSPDSKWIIFYARKRGAFIDNLWLCDQKGKLTKLTKNNREDSYFGTLGLEKTKLFYRYSESKDLYVSDLANNKIIKKRLPSDFGDGGSIANGKLAYETPGSSIKIKTFIKVIPLANL